MTDEETADWERYEADPNSENRNVLVARYSKLARKVALKYCSKLANNATTDQDDCIANAHIGLMDAISKFDRQRGVAFSTIARQRMLGAMLDAIRGLDWVPRLDRAKQSKGTLGHEPTVQFQSSGNRQDEDGRETWQINLYQGSEADPSEREQRIEWWRTALASLSRNERLLMLLYYREEHTMKQIGATLGLSESRVSQMHSAILERLDSHMATSRREELTESIPVAG